MRAFFPMRRGDRWYLLTLVVVAALAFLPWSRHTDAGSLPVFGWMMVGLMILAPGVALLRLAFGGRDAANHHSPSPTASQPPTSNPQTPSR